MSEAPERLAAALEALGAFIEDRYDLGATGHLAIEKRLHARAALAVVRDDLAHVADREARLPCHRCDGEHPTVAFHEACLRDYIRGRNEVSALLADPAAGTGATTC